MDKLERIFELQAAFDRQLAERRGLDVADRQRWIERKVLAMLSELVEVLDESNWKWWKNGREVDRDKIAEEMVDLLHFYVSLCLTLGIDAQALFDAYVEKNRENHRRQEGKSGRDGYHHSVPG